MCGNAEELCRQAESLPRSCSHNPPIMCVCESWTVYRTHVRQLNQFHMRCLRSLLHIPAWPDKTPYTEVLQQAVHTLLQKVQQVRWAGHVFHSGITASQSSFSTAKSVRESVLLEGEKKRFEDTRKASLKNFDIQVYSWEQPAQNRPMVPRPQKTEELMLQSKSVHSAKPDLPVPQQPNLPMCVLHV